MGDSSALEHLWLSWGRDLYMAIYRSKGRELYQYENDSFGDLVSGTGGWQFL